MKTTLSKYFPVPETRLSALEIDGHVQRSAAVTSVDSTSHLTLAEDFPLNRSSFFQIILDR